MYSLLFASETRSLGAVYIHGNFQFVWACGHLIQRLALLGSNVPKGSAISLDLYSLFVSFSSNKELLLCSALWWHFSAL